MCIIQNNTHIRTILCTQSRRMNIFVFCRRASGTLCRPGVWVAAGPRCRPHRFSSWLVAARPGGTGDDPSRVLLFMPFGFVLYIIYYIYIYIVHIIIIARPLWKIGQNYIHTHCTRPLCPPLIMIARAQCLPSSPSPKATGVRPPPTARSLISFFPRPDPPSSQPMLPPCFAVHAHVAVAAIRSGSTHGISRRALTAPVYHDHGIVSWRVTPRCRKWVGVGRGGGWNRSCAQL